MHNQYKYNDNYKVKSLEGDMYWCLPLLKNTRKLVFLSFMNVDPQSS
jgi:hypothetical protein